MYLQCTKLPFSVVQKADPLLLFLFCIVPLNLGACEIVKYLKIKTAYAFLESNKSDVIRVYIRHNYTNKLM